MPRHDWFDDDATSRDRSDWRERRMSDHESRDRGAMFGRDRERGERDFERGRSRERGERDFERGRNRPMGGWGGLMGEDMSRQRGRERFRDEERFGPDDYNRGIPMDETEQLIASNKVEGTPVYDRNGDKLGTIHNFMVHKTRGHVVYAVLKHGGGFLGLNERYYPLEWNQLTYDTRLGGYHVQLEEEDLKSFGSFDSEGRWHSRSGGGRSGRERESSRDYRREREMREPW